MIYDEVQSRLRNELNLEFEVQGPNVKRKNSLGLRSEDLSYIKGMHGKGLTPHPGLLDKEVGTQKARKTRATF